MPKGSLPFVVEGDVPAFYKPLVRSPFDKQLNVTRFQKVKLHELEGDGRFIIRKGDREMLEEDQFPSTYEACQKVKALFGELSQKYAIRAPSHFVVAADSSGQPAFFILTERVMSIKFENLDDTEKLRAANEMKGLFDTLLNYYEDKMDSGEDFLCDLPDFDQYVFGNLEGQSTGWHLVDTDPYFSRDPEQLLEVLCGALYEDLELVEEKFSIDLSSLRNRSSALQEKLIKTLDAE